MGAPGKIDGPDHRLFAHRRDLIGRSCRLSEFDRQLRCRCSGLRICRRRTGTDRGHRQGDGALGDAAVDRTGGNETVVAVPRDCLTHAGARRAARRRHSSHCLSSGGSVGDEDAVHAFSPRASNRASAHASPRNQPAVLSYTTSASASPPSSAASCSRLAPAARASLRPRRGRRPRRARPHPRAPARRRHALQVQDGGRADHETAGHHSTPSCRSD